MARFLTFVLTALLFICDSLTIAYGQGAASPVSKPLAADVPYTSISLKHITGDTVAEHLSRLYGDQLQVAFIHENNTLIVGGPEKVLGKVEELAKLMDVPSQMDKPSRANLPDLLFNESDAIFVDGNSRVRSAEFTPSRIGRRLMGKLNSAELAINKQLDIIQQAKRDSASDSVLDGLRGRNCSASS